MRRISSSRRKCLTMFRCDDLLAQRVSAIAERDGVSRSRVLRELVEYAIGAFESDEQAGGRAAEQAPESSTTLPGAAQPPRCCGGASE